MGRTGDRERVGSAGEIWASGAQRELRRRHEKDGRPGRVLAASGIAEERRRGGIQVRTDSVGGTERRSLGGDTRSIEDGRRGRPDVAVDCEDWRWRLGRVNLLDGGVTWSGRERSRQRKSFFLARFSHLLIHTSEILVDKLTKF